MPDHAATDVIVIGGGPGGSAAATCLAQGGLRVTLIKTVVRATKRAAELLHG